MDTLRGRKRGGRLVANRDDERAGYGRGLPRIRGIPDIELVLVLSHEMGWLWSYRNGGTPGFAERQRDGQYGLGSGLLNGSQLVSSDEEVARLRDALREGGRGNLLRRLGRVVCGGASATRHREETIRTRNRREAGNGIGRALDWPP